MRESKHSYCHNVRRFAIGAGIIMSVLTGCYHGSQHIAESHDDVPALKPDTLTNPEPGAIIEADDSVPKTMLPEDLMEFMNESDESDIYKEGIIPAIIEEAPEYAYRLLCNRFDKFLVVDKSRMKVILFDKFGRMEKSYGMACAKNYGTKHKKGDSRTPEGFFSVEGIYDSTEWLFTDDNGVTSEKKGQFGPRFIRIRIPGTSQIGIHGTCAPWSIGSRASHGCIRIKNENILELVELVEPGMPVIIVPGKRDMEQNMKDGVEISWIPTSTTSKKPVIKEENTETVSAPADSVNKASNDSLMTPPHPQVETPDTISTVGTYHSEE